MRELTALVLWCATELAAANPGHVRDLIEADRWREAVEEARALALSAPDDLDARACLGESLYRAGRIDEISRRNREGSDHVSRSTAEQAGALQELESATRELRELATHLADLTRRLTRIEAV